MATAVLVGAGLLMLLLVGWAGHWCADPRP